jgi:hypothetical protein
MVEEGSFILFESEDSNSRINIITEDSVIMSERNTARSCRSWPMSTHREETARNMANAKGTDSIEHTMVRGTSESVVWYESHELWGMVREIPENSTTGAERNRSEPVGAVKSVELFEYNLRPSAIGRVKPFPAGVEGPCLSCTEARKTRSRSERRPSMRIVSTRYIDYNGTCLCGVYTNSLIF